MASQKPYDDCEPAPPPYRGPHDLSVADELVRCRVAAASFTAYECDGCGYGADGPGWCPKCNRGSLTPTNRDVFTAALARAEVLAVQADAKSYPRGSRGRKNIPVEIVGVGVFGSFGAAARWFVEKVGRTKCTGTHVSGATREGRPLYGYTVKRLPPPKGRSRGAVRYQRTHTPEAEGRDRPQSMTGAGEVAYAVGVGA